MKICPMCGSDVLGGGDVRICSSCGADLEETKSSHQASSEGRNAPPASTASSTFGDAPIARSDDLEVVQSGEAFWAEPRRDNEKTDKIHNSEDVAQSSEKEEQSKSAEETQRVGQVKSTVFAPSEPKKDAPSLADLARQRRERLAREAAEKEAAEEEAPEQEQVADNQDTPEVESADEETDKHKPWASNGTAKDTDKDDPRDDAEATSRVDTHRGDSVPTLAGLTDSNNRTPAASEALSDTLEDPDNTPEQQPPTDSNRKEESSRERTPEQEPSTNSSPDTKATDGQDTSDDQEIKVVTQAPQIAYYDGNTVTVPGAHIQNGTTMLISGRPYELKRALSKSWLNRERLILMAGGLAAGLLIAMIISAIGGDSRSTMYGAVRDAASGKLLPGVTISINELGETVQTDPLGMFYFYGVDGGVYTLSSSDPIYGVASTPVSVAGDMTSVLLELEKPSAKPAAAPPKKQIPKKAPPPKKQPAKTKTVKRNTSPGKVAVAASISNAEIYLDGRLLGVGNGVYDNIKAGDHTVIVTREGYTTWEKKIRIGGGETSRIEPRLVPKDEIVAVEMTARQYYERGREAFDGGNYARAISDLDAAIEIERDPRYFAWRAEAHLALGNVARAERDYIDAIDGFDAAQEFSRLDQLYDRAIQALSSSAEIWFARGEYTYRRSKPTASVRSYRRALELGAEAKDCWIGIGLAEYARGNFQQASDAWTEADNLANRMDIRVAGYLALASAWLQYRTSCRSAVQRVESKPEILAEFRAHPDWEKVQRLTGGG